MNHRKTRMRERERERERERLECSMTNIVIDIVVVFYVLKALN